MRKCVESAIATYMIYNFSYKVLRVFLLYIDDVYYSSPSITLEITIVIKFEIILNIFWNILGITNHIIPRITSHTKFIKRTSNSYQFFSELHYAHSISGM